MDHKMAEIIRVALIGKTGVGKSAVGNTLLGDNKFLSSIGGESQTTESSAQLGKLPNGKLIKVVDTPGIMDTRGKEEFIRKEVTKVIGYLSPGPHAFLIVLRPDRMTREERQVISELSNLFGDENFLKYTVIVMVRKNDIRGKDRKPIEIHEYISKFAGEEVQKLYERCGRRIVAVDNNGCDDELQKYALEVASEIEKMGQKYYCHEYFKVMQRLHIKDDELEMKETEIKRLEQELQRVAAGANKEYCAIL